MIAAKADDFKLLLQYYHIFIWHRQQCHFYAGCNLSTLFTSTLENEIFPCLTKLMLIKVLEKLDYPGSCCCCYTAGCMAFVVHVLTFAAACTMFYLLIILCLILSPKIADLFSKISLILMFTNLFLVLAVGHVPYITLCY